MLYSDHLKTKTLHTKYVLRRKRDENDIIQKYKARIVVCSNEEDEID